MKFRSRFLLLNKAGDPEGGGTQDPPKTVSQEEYNDLKQKLDQTLNQIKELSTKNEEYSGKIKEFETKALEADGNKDGIIERLKEENETYKSNNETLGKKFSMALAKKELSSALKAKGCQYPSDAISLYANDLKNIGVNTDTFEADNKSIESLVSKIEKEKSYFFQTTPPKTSDIPQGGQFSNNNDTKDISIEEMKAILKEKITSKGD